MVRRVRDLLAQRTTEGLVGRGRELALLVDALADHGPPVTFIHGIGGMGKTRLLEAFLTQARGRGVVVLWLDGRDIEPTERGFLQALGVAIGGTLSSTEEAGERLAELGERIVLALDTYERLRLLDTWLRQVFIPVLPTSVRTVLAGREAPVPAWLTAPGWQGLVRALALEPLTDADAVRVLETMGVPASEAPRINRFTRGHPLALALAAAGLPEARASAVADTAFSHVVDVLTRLYLSDIDDPLTRVALQATAVVRRSTLSLLGPMLPQAAPQDIFERLRAVPFVERAGDGLHLHDVVQQAVALDLRATDPTRYQAYRRAAWRQLRREVSTAATPELWRYTADMLYLIENPVVREAFFPSDMHRYAVEPARDADGPAIRAAIRRHEPPEAAQVLEAWWEAVPETFCVVRGSDGTVAGLYCMAEPPAIPAGLLQRDAAAQGWREHLRRLPVPRGQRVLLIRRWLDTELGEAPSAVQAACWLDIKRAYMALRPHVRRVYLTLHDLPAYAPVAQRLGFAPQPDLTVRYEGVPYHTAVLDFGPASVDGWLAGLVAAELGMSEDALLDAEAHECVLDGRRISLTPLEFGVLQYLHAQAGRAVPRAALLEHVWGYQSAADSNVVDVTVLALRKKLADRAGLVETVRGVGYRFKPDG